MLHFITFLEACGELDAPSHSHPPKREFWVHPFNAERESSKVFETFYKKIRTYPKKFFAYFRMSISSFDELMELVRTDITKQWTVFRNPVSAELRLTVTLR